LTTRRPPQLGPLVRQDPEGAAEVWQGVREAKGDAVT
jgi:hypothetical protein